MRKLHTKRERRRVLHKMGKRNQLLAIVLRCILSDAGGRESYVPTRYNLLCIIVYYYRLYYRYYILCYKYHIIYLYYRIVIYIFYVAIATLTVCLIEGLGLRDILRIIPPPPETY